MLLRKQWLTETLAAILFQIPGFFARFQALRALLVILAPNQGTIVLEVFEEGRDASDVQAQAPGRASCSVHTHGREGLILLARSSRVSAKKAAPQQDNP